MSDHNYFHHVIVRYGRVDLANSAQNFTQINLE